MRVLDDGTTQLQQATYNISYSSAYDPNYIGTSNLTSQTDAIGRKTVFNYAADGINLTSVQQQTSGTGTLATIAVATYDANHNVLTQTDAAGQVWRYAYNAAGQMIYASNPLNQTRFWEYDAAGRQTRVTVPVAVAYASVVYGTTNTMAATAQSYNYTVACSGMTAPANTNLPISVTDSEGRKVCYQYDALDRVTLIKYPDGTTDSYDYIFPTTWPVVASRGTPSLDVWKITDRMGRVTNINYDQNRRKVADSETVTVNGVTTTRTTAYEYYEDGALKNLTDANGNVTHWEVDIQSRPTSKTYAYGTAAAKTESYTYDLAGRQKTMTDALGQTKTFSYNADNSVASYAYTNAVVPTAGASFTYDPYFARRTGMVDQFGTTSLTYKPIGTQGALQLDTENPPFTNDTVAYGYDALGRVNSRKIDVATDSVTYDALGRMNQHTVQDLGVFNYAYLGQTGAPLSRIKTVNGISTNWAYDTNNNDRRLKTITNSNNARSYALTSTIYQLTGSTETMPVTHPFVNQSWTYGYDASDRLLSATSTTAANSKAFAYDKLDNATNFGGVAGSYNGLNQIASFGGTAYTYDANGNLTNDGTRTYTYDAADRLVRINYVGNATMKSEFGYDGLGRRITQTETPTTGAAVTTRNLWCGAMLCQERTSADVVAVRYYAEGERRPVTGEAYVSVQDSLGSVREMVGAGSGLLKMAYDYDAYGKPTQTWKSASTHTNRRYAGLMLHPNSGLYLSATRAYNPANGKWLNADPIREAGGANLTGYVGGSPTMGVDPLGLRPLTDREKKLLLPYIPQIDLDNADLHEDGTPLFVPDSKSAVTMGNDIYFRDGPPNTCSAGGLSLLGHELVHVGQFRNGLTWLGYISDPDRDEIYEKPAYAVGAQIKKDMSSVGSDCGGCNIYKLPPIKLMPVH